MAGQVRERLRQLLGRLFAERPSFPSALPSNNLVGTLPASLGALTGLSYLQARLGYSFRSAA